jgi:hypothetical protein
MQAKYKKLENNLVESSLRISEIYASDEISNEEKEQQSKLVLELLTAKNKLLTAYEESVITLGQITIKMSLLLNGGAAVALMALFSKISEGEVFINYFAKTIVDFGLGVMVACIAAACTYVARKYLIENKYRLSIIFNSLAFTFIMLSYIFFLIGVNNFI